MHAQKCEISRPTQGCKERAAPGKTASTQNTPPGLHPTPHREFLSQPVRETKRRPRPNAVRGRAEEEEGNSGCRWVGEPNVLVSRGAGGAGDGRPMGEPVSRGAEGREPVEWREVLFAPSFAPSFRSCTSERTLRGSSSQTLSRRS
jgi:hypothetical protein